MPAAKKYASEVMAVYPHRVEGVGGVSIISFLETTTLQAMREG
jgi:hypothetical protein